MESDPGQVDAVDSFWEAGTGLILYLPRWTEPLSALSGATIVALIVARAAVMDLDFGLL